MHRYGYLGEQLNRAANGSHLYEPSNVVEIGSIELARPEGIVASAALYNLLARHIKQTCDYSLQHPSDINGDIFKLDGCWETWGSAYINPQSMPNYIFGTPAPIIMRIIATDENPWTNEIFAEYSAVELTPDKATYYTHALQPDSLDYFISEDGAHELDEQQMRGLWLDLATAISAHEVQKNPPDGS